MPLELGIKASGQLGTSQSTLYQTTPSQTASVKVDIVNTSSSTVKVNLWLKDGIGTARLISPKDLELKAKHHYSTCYHELGESDGIQGQALVAGFVDYSITGFIRT